MKEELERIEGKIDSMQEDMAEIKLDLRYHIKRTDLLEEHVKGQETSLAEAVLPIRWAKTTTKILAGLGAIAGAILALREIGWL